MNKELYIFPGGGSSCGRFSFDLFSFLSKKQINEFTIINSFSIGRRDFSSPFLSVKAINTLERMGALSFNVAESKIEALRKDFSSFFLHEFRASTSNKYFLLLSHFERMSQDDFYFLFSLLRSLQERVKLKFVFPFRNFLGELNLSYLNYMSDLNRLQAIFEQRIKNINDYYMNIFSVHVNSLIENLNFLFREIDFEILDLDLASFDVQYLGKKLSAVLGVRAAKDFVFEFDNFTKLKDFVSPYDVSRIKSRYPQFGYEHLHRALKNARDLLGDSELAIRDLFKVAPLVSASCKQIDDLLINRASFKPSRKNLQLEDGSACWNYYDF